MIRDQETNSLYVADCLPLKYPKFFPAFKQKMKECNVSLQFLPDCNDVWAVDFMPVQIGADEFVQFDYSPDYLLSDEWRNTISDVDHICNKIRINTRKSSIVIDGGNVVHGKDTVIMCDKVIRENPSLSREDLRRSIGEILEVDRVIFIPTHKDDFTGHADGMVRFLDDRCVLINRLVPEEKELGIALRRELALARLDYIEVPYHPELNHTYIQARGFYINYLQMENLVVIPTFNCVYDKQATREFEKLFPGTKIMNVSCNEIADQGGVLNCITWNIKAV